MWFLSTSVTLVQIGYYMSDRILIIHGHYPNFIYTTLWDRAHYYIHFLDQEIGTKTLGSMSQVTRFWKVHGFNHFALRFRDFQNMKARGDFRYYFSILHKLLSITQSWAWHVNDLALVISTAMSSGSWPKVTSSATWFPGSPSHGSVLWYAIGFISLTETQALSLLPKSSFWWVFLCIFLEYTHHWLTITSIWPNEPHNGWIISYRDEQY